VNLTLTRLKYKHKTIPARLSKQRDHHWLHNGHRVNSLIDHPRDLHHVPLLDNKVTKD
jgi:hypothetical protein